MSELVRSVGLLSFQQVVLMLLGATRTKFAASLLGPSGMGLLAQAASKAGGAASAQADLDALICDGLT